MSQEGDIATQIERYGSGLEEFARRTAPTAARLESELRSSPARRAARLVLCTAAVILLAIGVLTARDRSRDEDPVSASVPAELAGLWRLVDYRQADATQAEVERPQAYVRFFDGALSASDGCNSITARKVEYRSKAVEVDPASISSTLAACVPPLPLVEVLTTPSPGFSFEIRGGVLTLVRPDTGVLFHAERSTTERP